MALYDVKNQLSRIVPEAEEGTATKLTRHGKPAAVIIGAEQYDTLTNREENFSALYERFRKKWGAGVDDVEREYADPFSDIRKREPGRTIEL